MKLAKVLVALVALSVVLVCPVIGNDGTASTGDVADIGNSDGITDSEITYLGWCYYEFDPQQDITLKELSLCVKYIHGDRFNNMTVPQEIKRHFIERCQTYE